MRPRKRWTQEEEDVLICKYGELQQSGFVSKMKSRERKFEPIAAHVNALFHSQDPVAYPWLWTWKDASTKVQNMRHQYLGVKQKIKRIVSSVEGSEQEEYIWEEGVAHWPNFLTYRMVFGDQELDVNDFLSSGSLRVAVESSQPKSSFKLGMHSFHMAGVGDGSALMDGGGMVPVTMGEEEMEAACRDAQIGMDAGGGVLGLGLGFEYEGEGDQNEMKDGGEDYEEENEEVALNARKRRRYFRKVDMGLETPLSESRIMSFIATQFAELSEREARREEREKEREIERVNRALLRAEKEKEKERLRQQWEVKREEQERSWHEAAATRERGRVEQALKRHMLERQTMEEERQRERAWEEKMESEKMEWAERIEALQLQHQAAILQIQSQIAQSQQNTGALLLGVLLQFTGQGDDLTGHGLSFNPFVSQLLQNLQQPGNAVLQCGIRRAGGGSNESHFDVDG